MENKNVSLGQETHDIKSTLLQKVAGCKKFLSTDNPDWVLTAQTHHISSKKDNFIFQAVQLKKKKILSG